MNRFHKIVAPAIIATLATFSVASAQTMNTATMAPGSMQNMRGECQSGHNIAHVRRRLDGTIDRLQHDQHDYQGHRVTAIGDLQQARQELLQAEQMEQSTQPTAPNPNQQNCYKAGGSTGGSDKNWGERNQQASNSNLARVRHSIERMIDQLQRDNHDYGGHRVAAITDLQRARAELEQARDVAPGMTPTPRPY